MEFHRGRLIDHVHLRVEDLDAAYAFYAAALAPLGLDVQRMGDHAIFVDELWIDTTAEPTRGMHIAFQAPDEATIAAFHEAAIAAGGTDNGAPGERSYHPGYYAAFVLAPDGTNVEAVLHGPAERSAPSVVIRDAADLRVARAAFTVDSFEPQRSEQWGANAFGTVLLTKTFTGDLEATSVVEMIAASTSVETSRAYAAFEHITGTLHGAEGSFVLQHQGIATEDASQASASWTIVPDSGEGALAGITGGGTIEVGADGAHLLELRYRLPAST